MNTDLIMYSLRNIWERKMRSFLTVLSILIGIMAIFALVSFGQGMKQYIDDFSKELGTDKLVVQARGFGPPGSSGVTFSQEDVDFFSKIKGVTDVAGMYFVNSEVRAERDEVPKYVYVIGVPTDSSRHLVEAIYNLDLDSGRNLKGGDKLKVALGYNYQIADKVFPEALHLGDRIYVNGIVVEIVGFFEALGNPEDDRNIYFSDEGFLEVFGDRGYAMITMQAGPGEDPVNVAERAEEKFRKRKGQKEGEEDFFVQTFDQFIEAFTNVIVVLNGILVIIALISLVIAAINIMNTMYTAVLERTKEIGIMKAVGSRNKSILLVFVVESGLLGLVGGVIGIMLGYVIASIGGYAAAQAGLGLLKPAFPWWLIVGCLLFAFLVGAGSGFLPALHASRQKPVDALRYE
ncbi:MAG: ABC transporter permease [Nanoarchaeota archaeon]|nr:ABC transporter permease [Nanoarchaeota archaeon]